MALREVFPLDWGCVEGCFTSPKPTRARRSQMATPSCRAGCRPPLSGGALCRPPGGATAGAVANSSTVA